jgi:hypothetical protein
MLKPMRSKIIGAAAAALLAVAAIVVVLHGTFASNRASGPLPTPTGVAPSMQVCGSSSLRGPARPPSGAVTVAAGDDSGDTLSTPDTTYYFATGIHTLGRGAYDQIIPGDKDTYIGAPGAVLSGQNLNEFAFDQAATLVTIEYLTIEDFTPPINEGAVNASVAPDWTIEHDTIEDNVPGTGAYMGTNNVLEHDCITENGQEGIGTFTSIDTNRVTGGGSNYTVVGNEISFNDTCNVEDDSPDPVPAADQPHSCGEIEPGGCGCTGGFKMYTVDGSVFEDNFVHDNYSVGLWYDGNCTSSLVEGNVIDGNWGEGLQYEISYNALIEDNTFADNAWGGGPTLGRFPDPAVYVSDSGGDAALPGAYSGEILIRGNTFTNNWSGVVLWNDGGRFCGNVNSPSSASLCAITGNDPSLYHFNGGDTPGGCGRADLQGASAGVDSGTPPADYFDNCHWTTQHVTVTDNTFAIDPTAIPDCNGQTNFCGTQGLFSNDSTSPTWTPYGTYYEAFIISPASHNVFSDNTYSGPWTFMYHDQSLILSQSQWRDDGQDTGSKWS